MAQAKKRSRSSKAIDVDRLKAKAAEADMLDFISQIIGRRPTVRPRLLQMKKSDVAVSPEIIAGLRDSHAGVRRTMPRIEEVINRSGGMTLQQAEIIHAALCSLQVVETAFNAQGLATGVMRDGVKTGSAKVVRARNAD